MLSFIYGTDAYRCQEKLKELTNSFIAKRDKAGINVVKITGDKFDFDLFRQEVLAVPFLGEKKMIIVKDLLRHLATAGGKKTDKLITDFLKERQDKLDNVVCFIDIVDSERAKKSRGKAPFASALFGLLKKEKFVWELNTLAGKSLINWLDDFTKDKKIKISNKALEKLIAFTDSDLSQIILELEKLAAYKNREEINETDVGLLVSGKSDDNIFNLVDAIGKKDRRTTLRLIDAQLKNGTPELMILKMISRQFRIMLQIKSGGGSDSGLPMFIIAKTRGQTDNFTLEKLIEINRTLLELEKKFKSGERHSELLLDLFALRY